MKRKSTILVVHKFDDGQTARRFVAVLCFLEFYTLFVYYGRCIWNMNGDMWVGAWNAMAYIEGTRIALFACTPLLYLCGRGLWLGGRWQMHWLWVGIVGLLAIILIDSVTAFIESLNIDYTAFGLVNVSESWIPEELYQGLQAACFHLPFWATLLTLSIVTRSGSRWQRKDRALWVYCAAAYCLAMTVASIFEQSLVRSTFDLRALNLATFWGAAYVVPVVSGAILLSAAVLLIRGSRIARSFALITATFNAVAVVHRWFVLAWLVNISVEALLRSVPFSTPVERPYSWTLHDFMWLVVMPAHYVLPWLLIAVYAWRVRMRRLPDDGTPFPRRFCAHCLYNLYGNETDRCPECGRALGAVTRSADDMSS